ncbi:MAG TPA: hypothetical protein VI818_08770 [Candidatus Thermoplasmatota archaeon]|nr:hypothetical protein [Candidatus Thermoplasmatota archaeon]
MRVLVVLLAALVLVPGAAAQGTIRVRVTPQSDQVTLTAGERTDVPLTVNVEFVGTTCQSGAEVGVSLLLGTFPSWAGASIRPQSARYANPRQTRTATLEMLPDEEDAPDGGTVTYQIEPLLSAPNATSCPTSPSVDAPKAHVTATVRRPDATGSGGPDGGDGGSPGFSALLWLVSLGLGLAWGRRRGHR